MLQNIHVKLVHFLKLVIYNQGYRSTGNNLTGGKKHHRTQKIKQPVFLATFPRLLATLPCKKSERCVSILKESNPKSVFISVLHLPTRVYSKLENPSNHLVAYNVTLF